MIPQTQYAKRPEGSVAYQVLGEGPLDLVFISDWVNNLEVMWDEPSLARFLRRLASFSRLICYDKLGYGVSDRFSGTYTSLDNCLDDVRVVMEAAGSKRAAVLGVAEGGMVAMLLAATYPKLVSSLILADASACRLRHPDYPWGIPQEYFETYAAGVQEGFGTDRWIPVFAPSRMDDRAFREWYARYVRLTMGPGDQNAGWQNLLLRNDLRPILPGIRQPTLVLHRADNGYIRVGNGRYLGEHIPNAKYVEVPGSDHLFYVGETEMMLNEIQEFLTGGREIQEHDRVLATILFADIVDSTQRAAELGDRRWREMLEAYYDVARRETARFRGREVDTAGDGYFASFDGPARAVRSACAIRDGVLGLDIQIRAGLHTGECERIGDKLGGIAVHIGARVAGHAGPSEVLVSSTVKDLVAGSGLEFEERGAYRLKGVPGEWRLYAARM
jgi:pimeloyl-ACP methyl ester carboxylesterase